MADSKPIGSAKVEQDIQRTREQLGDTVEALAHKLDVPARVKSKAHETTETVQLKAEEVAKQVQDKTQQAKRQVQQSAEALQSKAEDVAEQAKSMGSQAIEKLPPPVASRVEPLMTTARQRPILIAFVTVAGLWMVRRLLLRRKR